jgi:hypothetical protein
MKGNKKMKNKKNKSEIIIFDPKKYPVVFEQGTFSVYKGVIIVWDIDNDPRILTFIDNLPRKVRENLEIAQEHEAGLFLGWYGDVPKEYEFGKEFNVENDNWSIQKSETIKENRFLISTSLEALQ